ncbi:MAG: sigma-54 dependent transcriptional regulator [bacterium]
MQKALLVDDEERILNSFSKGLESIGWEVATALSGAAALELLEAEQPEAVITDLVMPGMDGLALLAEIKKRDPQLPVIIVTGHGTVETAVRAMKEGAFDYITKPFNLDEVDMILRRAVEHKRLLAENVALKNQIRKQFSFSNIIGVGDTMQGVYRVMDKIKDTRSSVLVTGESGTGKELIAKAIHFNGFLRDKAFVTVDCASLAENLLESELFGHVKGAFTGAHRDKEGYFEAADGGTIFLDEIAEFSPHLQTRLLRVLQEGEFSRVGDNRTVKVHVRVIAATNRNLEQAVRQGKFREDLYYRLNVIHLVVPPLRKRLEDIPDLVTHFIAQFNEKFSKNVDGISPEALSVFAYYNWPGNVRELENHMERNIIFCDDRTIHPRHLQEPLKSLVETGVTSEGIKDLAERTYKDAKNLVVKKFNKDYFTELLNRSGSNISEASRKSGIERSCFYRMLKKYDIPIEERE